MSKCKFCGEEFNFRFKYCPSCGKKDAAPSTDIEWYMSAGGQKEFEADWEKLRRLDAQRFIKEVAQPHSAVVCWTIGAEYFHINNGRFGPERRRSRTGSIRLDSVSALIQNERDKNVFDLTFFVNEKMLGKTDLAYIGDGVYLDKATCEEVLRVLEDSRHE